MTYKYLDDTSQKDKGKHQLGGQRNQGANLDKRKHIAIIAWICNSNHIKL